MSFDDLRGKFQRDINRIADIDRNTRKRGLQKLLDDLPWSDTSQRNALCRLAEEVLWLPLVAAISDSVEKCRESALQLILKVVDLSSDVSIFSGILVTSLSQRINENPFPEQSEELRLQISAVLEKVIRHPSLKPGKASFQFPDLLDVLPKALSDPFPSAKKQLADLVVSIAELWGEGKVLFSTSLFKSLAANALHQQHKVQHSMINLNLLTVIIFDCIRSISI